MPGAAHVNFHIDTRNRAYIYSLRRAVAYHRDPQNIRTVFSELAASTATDREIALLVRVFCDYATVLFPRGRPEAFRRWTPQAVFVNYGFPELSSEQWDAATKRGYKEYDKDSVELLFSRLYERRDEMSCKINERAIVELEHHPHPPTQRRVLATLVKIKRAVNKHNRQGVRRVRRGRGYTYIVQAGTRGPFKIGRSENNVKARLADLQVSNHCQLQLVALIRGAAHEKELHSKFRRYRLRGEWFRARRELVKFARRCARWCSVPVPSAATKTKQATTEVQSSAP